MYSWLHNMESFTLHRVRLSFPPNAESLRFMSTIFAYLFSPLMSIDFWNCRDKQFLRRNIWFISYLIWECNFYKQTIYCVISSIWNAFQLFLQHGGLLASIKDLPLFTSISNSQIIRQREVLCGDKYFFTFSKNQNFS